jgi:bacterial/archaeal transporter family-2 protein
MSSSWAYPFIVIGGILQAVSTPINGELKRSLANPWLASSVSFLLVTFLTIAVFGVQPTPLPTLEDLRRMKWWAPLGGIVGAVAVLAGLTLVQKVGVGTLNGLTICANLIASVAIDHFGLVGATQHPLNGLRLVGTVLMVAGVTLVMRFWRRARNRCHKWRHTPVTRSAVGVSWEPDQRSWHCGGAGPARASSIVPGFGNRIVSATRATSCLDLGPHSSLPRSGPDRIQFASSGANVKLSPIFR